jgi:hypothetical protein
MKKNFPCIILTLLAFAAPVFAAVSISKPTNGETVGSPVQFVATATTSCSGGVASMGVYINNVLEHTEAGSSLNTSVSLSPGSYNAVVVEWDNCGTSTTASRSIKVTGTTGVSVTSPANNSTVESPASFIATAQTSSCAQGVSSMGIYVDNALKYKVSGAALSTQLAIAVGTHQAVVEEWDHCGGASTASVDITVKNGASSASTGIDISSPSSGEHVSSPFTLSASSSDCQSEAVRTIGYSLDNSPDTTLFEGSTTLDAKVSETVGTHTVHVKTWNTSGAVCVAEVAIDVTNATDDAATATVPSDALTNSSLQTLSNWVAIHDTGTSGGSVGYMSLVGTPEYSGPSRKFTTDYSNYGGERYSVTFGDDRTSTNFLWDGWVYLTSNSTNLANLEMDLEQTMSNGQTVVFGFQCDGNYGTWDYSENVGTAANPVGSWKHSSAACNPRSWSINTWHHVQISYSRTTSGSLTYKSVYLDGVEKTLNATVFGARDLGWGSSMTINFQVDGRSGSGTTTVYLDDLTLKRW